MIIELIFAVCYGWCATSEYRLKIDVFARTGSLWLKISGRRGRPSQKTRINNLSCGLRMLAQVSFVLSQSTRLTDRRTKWPEMCRVGRQTLPNSKTDRRTDISLMAIPCERFTCSCTAKSKKKPSDGVSQRQLVYKSCRLHKYCMSTCSSGRQGQGQGLCQLQPHPVNNSMTERSWYFSTHLFTFGWNSMFFVGARTGMKEFLRCQSGKPLGHHLTGVVIAAFPAVPTVSEGGRLRDRGDARDDHQY